MGGVFETAAGVLIQAYNSLVSALGGSDEAVLLVKMLFFVAIITLSAAFIWRFYNSLSNKNIVSLNLSKYNKSQHPVFSKIIAILFYLIEYMILAPIMIFIWFAAISVVLMLVAKERGIDEILAISIAMVGAIRILAYYRKSIAADLAKLFPLTMLAVFLLEPGSLNTTRIISHLTQIPDFFDSIISFFLVVFVIEFSLRLLYTTYEFWFSEEVAAAEEAKKSRVVKFR